MFTKRDVLTVVLLSVFTCGVYLLYWYYTTIQELYNSSGRSVGELSPAVQFLLMFTPVGPVLFAVNADDNLNEVKIRMGIPPQDQKLTYILLALICNVACVALVQEEMNRISDSGTYNNYPTYM